MKHKDAIEQALTELGFEKIFYSQKDFDEIANAYNNMGSENYTEEKILELIQRLESEKFCLVQNIILDNKVITANVFFMSVKEVSADILDKLLLTSMKVSISPLKEDLSNVSVDFVTTYEEV